MFLRGILVYANKQVGGLSALTFAVSSSFGRLGVRIGCLQDEVSTAAL